MSKFDKLTECSHDDNGIKSIFCNEPNCWKASGLCSRYVEKQMKNIKIGSYLLHDEIPFTAEDFIILNKFVNDHNYNDKLHEMKKYGKQWQRLIEIWNELNELLNNK